MFTTCFYSRTQLKIACINAKVYLLSLGQSYWLYVDFYRLFNFVDTQKTTGFSALFWASKTDKTFIGL